MRDSSVARVVRAAVAGGSCAPLQRGLVVTSCVGTIRATHALQRDPEEARVDSSRAAPTDSPQQLLRSNWNQPSTGPTGL